MAEGSVPRHVQLIRDFVNTYEPQINSESLSGPTAWRTWITAQGLPVPKGAVTPGDLAAAIALREGFRNVLLVHAGHAPDPAALSALQSALADLPVRLHLDEAAQYRLVSIRPDPTAHALCHILDAVRAAREDGTWARIKVCDRDTCRWAYYDASRNQVRRWCSMAGCGNYIKMRRARSKHHT